MDTITFLALPPPSVSFTIRLGAEDAARLAELARAAGVAPDVFAREAVRAALGRRRVGKST